jgi:hypothetical protein
MPPPNLRRLSSGARSEILRVLLAPSAIRASLIRQMHERQDTKDLAEVLIDLEADDTLRLAVADALKNTMP